MNYDKVTNSEWEELILKSDNASFFLSPSWAKIMEKTFNYSPATRLYNIDGKEILIPMMERNVKYGFKTLDSMPGNFEHGGLFSKSEITNDDFKSIVKDIVGGKNLILHMNLSSRELASKITEKWKVKDEWPYTHLLELEGKNYEDIWKNDFHQKVRRAVRKAKKSGVEVREGTSEDDFKTFYDIYATAATQKWDMETPHIPFKSFKNSYKYGSDYVKLSLAIKDDKVIAGIIDLWYSKTVYYSFGSFLSEYGTYNPTSLLFNESIKRACQEGYKYYNFGPSGTLKNVRKFKEAFGAGKVELNRYKVYSNLGKLVSKITSKI